MWGDPYNYDLMLDPAPPLHPVGSQVWSCPSPLPCGEPVHLVFYLYQSEFTWNQLVQVTGVNSLNYVCDFLGPPFPFGWFITYVINDIRYLGLGHFVQKKGKKKVIGVLCHRNSFRKKGVGLTKHGKKKSKCLKKLSEVKDLSWANKAQKGFFNPPPPSFTLTIRPITLTSCYQFFLFKTSYLFKMETKPIKHVLVLYC